MLDIYQTRRTLNKEITQPSIFRSSYRKLALVEFESTTTEFFPDALTNWAIRPCVQLALRANFVQLLLPSSFFQCSDFKLAIASVSHHIHLNPIFAQPTRTVSWFPFLYCWFKSKWQVFPKLVERLFHITYSKYQIKFAHEKLCLCQELWNKVENEGYGCHLHTK